MEENKKTKKEKEQEYIEELVKIGKKISLEAAEDKKLEDRIKKMSSY